MTTDFTLTGAGSPSGGTLTTVATYSSGTLVIYRVVPETQTLDLVQGDGFQPNSVEAEFDKLTMMAQQISRIANSSFHLSDSDVSGADTTIPTPVALGVLQWNATGDALQSVASVGTGDITVPSSVDDESIVLFDGTGGNQIKESDFEITSSGFGHKTNGVKIDRIIDEDSFASDLATAVPTQQSTKAYIDGKVTTLNTAVADAKNPDVFWIQHQETAGTSGGSLATGAFRTRTLNVSVLNEITGASLGSNQITLPAGTYEFDLSCVASDANDIVCRLQNVTDGTTVCHFISQETFNIYTTSNYPTVTMSGKCKFTIADTKVFELQQRNSNASTKNMGGACNYGKGESYTNNYNRKIA